MHAQQDDAKRMQLPVQAQVPQMHAARSIEVPIVDQHGMRKKSGTRTVAEICEKTAKW